MTREQINKEASSRFTAWRGDWNMFASDVFGVTLDNDQQDILTSVQFNPRTSVASGTARGKDFVAAVAAMCFFYLTPRWNSSGQLVDNTKVALTAPTGRQVDNIMQPEFARLYNKALQKGIDLPGRLVSNDIRTDWDEWYLTAFKADSHSHEAWSGFHAVNTMFIITEASGIADDTYSAIEGNLQGNSRILLVFNPNTTVGYAAKSQKSPRWNKFRLSSLTAPNVVSKKIIIPGQVDYDWVKDKLENWCTPITEQESDPAEDDFCFDGQWYRPEDLFRVKVLGKFPKVSEDTLIPEQWIELAEKRWQEFNGQYNNADLKLGVDVAGMGRDNSVFAYRYDNYLKTIKKLNSGGKAEHMKIAGIIKNELDLSNGATAMIDTIGEGAGVYARLVEQGYSRALSAKYSESARDDFGNPLKDITGVYEFANMRAYLFWCVRDWFNPRNGFNAMVPPGGTLKQEATEIKWAFRSDGKVLIEKKEDIKKRLGFSTDEFDALANTFYPITDYSPQDLTGIL